jgi:large subunit ribosomal protein L4
LFAQKGTGRARRGAVRSPLLRGGGKAFGPRNDANFHKDMPKSMRHAALRSCLSAQAKQGAIFGLEDYPDTIKTKTFSDLMKKLPVELGRRILFVVPQAHNSLWMSSRNIQRVKILPAAYLNPEDVLLARKIIFVGDAVEKAMEVFAGSKKKPVAVASEEKKPTKPKKPKTPKKAPSKKSA